MSIKFITIRLDRMRNAEYFQFITEFKNMFTTFSPATMKIVKFFALFMKLFEQLDLCLVILQKSGYTELMHEADQKRDSIFSGLYGLVKTCLKHFNEEVRAAAKRLEILFKANGNLAQKPDDEETAGIYNLIQDLEGKYAADIALIGATEWVAELKASNKAYETLVNNRDLESAEKPEAKVKEIRVEMDNAYRDMTTSIEMFAKLAETPVEIERYKTFITQWNVIVERYKNRLSQRKGAADAKKDKKDENPEIVTSED